MTVAPALATREQLIHALHEAAELEQNLMCTYLYAVFSLKSAGEGLNEEEVEAVKGWRRAILDIAIDEMSHLAAVWNITAAIGGIYLERPASSEVATLNPPRVQDVGASLKL
jgi:hypothetical protein